jgi:hypothetical protein
VAGRWFSLGTSVSSANKTECHDITEILLKVVLNKQTNWIFWYFCKLFYGHIFCIYVYFYCTSDFIFVVNLYTFRHFVYRIVFLSNINKRMIGDYCLDVLYTLNIYISRNMKKICIIFQFHFSKIHINTKNVAIVAMHDHMVVGFTTTSAISAYHHCKFESRSGWGVQHYVIKFVSDLRQVCGFLWVLLRCIWYLLIALHICHKTLWLLKENQPFPICLILTTLFILKYF